MGSFTEVKRFVDVKISHGCNRQWTTLAAEPYDEQVYKLVSYNILAQDQLEQNQSNYSDVNSAALSWRHRLNNLQREFETLNADIWCLQGVQNNHLPQIMACLQTEAREFKCFYHLKQPNRTDGLAILYDKHKFLLVDCRALANGPSGSHKLDREHYALVAKLKLRQPPPPDSQGEERVLVVVNTHLLLDGPGCPDVHQAQVQHLLQNISEFCVDSATQKRNPIVMAGDFGFDMDSTVFSVLDSRSASVEHPPMVPVFSQSGVASTYAPTTGKWTCADHILYSHGQRHEIRVCSYYKPPRIAMCERTGKLPNMRQGSDHYSVGVTFALRKYSLDHFL